MAYIRQSYDGLVKKGVNKVSDRAVALDPAKRTVRTAGGQSFGYDRLIVAPGIEMRFDAIEGYSEAVSEKLPHAWKAGKQTEILKAQIEAMPDGGVFLMVAPPNPYRCPPGPYERASLVAEYLQRNKPKSKVIILDPKEGFSKQGLFQQGWDARYDNGGEPLIEWVGGADGGLVERVEVAARTVVAKAGRFEGAVINVIPPQRAGKVAHEFALADQSGWCPVNQRTYESRLVEGVHVIGDACIAGPVPKSAYGANSEAKVCAMAVAALLNGQDPPAQPTWVNTCYSLVAADYGISVAGVYFLDAEGKTAENKDAGGVSPKAAPPENRLLEARYADGWYRNIVADTFG